MQPLQNNRFGAYLNQQHFLGTLILAFLLHAGGVGLYHILPREAIEMIPVRVLNIKIGKTPPVNAIPAGDPAGTKQEVKTAVVKPQPTVKKPVVAPQPKKPVPPKTVKPAPKAAVKPPRPQPVIKSAVVAAPKVNPLVPTPQSVEGKTITQAAQEAAAQQGGGKQYIREDSLAAASGDSAEYGSPLGNSREASAEIERRYTQTLSLWINKFKIYPVEARQAGIGGTVMLRLRINRQGRILQFYLEKASGYPAIDQAISTMVNAANPVPAVPPYYPDSRPYLEFLVPIHFKP